jgi:hypothetical protein
VSEKPVEVAIDELAYTTERTVNLAERGISALLAGVARAIEGVLDFLVPEARLTPDQAERAALVAQERADDCAIEAVAQERIAAQDWQLHENQRADRQDRLFAELGYTHLIRLG